ncbi:MAG TPA: PilZ domain-containing protein [Xanthomonadales bacterium]|nr:PilZ domain-containing protein [Xanthomonadales bacterium]
MDFSEKRRHPRKDIFTAALLALGEEGYLTEVWDLSQGGARMGRPKRWNHAQGAPVRIYFMLDQETVIAMTAKVVRVTDEYLGLEFNPKQEDRIQTLLYEARFLEQSGA